MPHRIQVSSRVGGLRPSPLSHPKIAGYGGMSGDWGAYFNLTEGAPPYPMGTAGIDSAANLPALNSAWTIEGWMWGGGATCTTYGTAAWGVLGGTPSSPSPSGSAPLAGIVFGAGAGAPNTAFLWPGAGSGVGLPAGGPCGMSQAAYGSTPNYVALDWDGQNVRGYLGGQLVSGFPVATTGAGIAAAPAGFTNYSFFSGLNLDELRISNVARYTGGTMTVPAQPFASDSQAVLLWHLDSSLGRGVERQISGGSLTGHGSELRGRLLRLGAYRSGLLDGRGLRHLRSTTALDGLLRPGGVGRRDGQPG